MTVFLALSLGACSSETKTTTTQKKDEYKPIAQSAIDSTVNDMKTRENIKDATFTVNGDKIEMKLVVDGASLTDKDAARDYADSYLRTISIYVDGSNPTKDSYGKVYDGYYVHIVVEDQNGIQAIEGQILPGYSGISWE
jgi:hypothetical protein